jgi:pentatricopeptide repeat protein
MIPGLQPSKAGRRAATTSDHARLNVEDVLIPIIFFIFLGAVILLPKWMRMREREKALEVMKAMSEKGVSPDPALLEVLQSEAWRNPDRMASMIMPLSQRDLRGGSILIAVAVALVVLAGILYAAGGERHAPYVLLGVSAFPGLIGLTRLGFWWAARARRDAL